MAMACAKLILIPLRICESLNPNSSDGSIMACKACMEGDPVDVSLCIQSSSIDRCLRNC